MNEYTHSQKQGSFIDRTTLCRIRTFLLFIYLCPETEIKTDIARLIRVNEVYIRNLVYQYIRFMCVQRSYPKGSKTSIIYYNTSSSNSLSKVLSKSAENPGCGRDTCMQELFTAVSQRNLSGISIFAIAPPSLFPRHILSKTCNPSFKQLTSNSEENSFNLFSFIV